MSKWRLEGPERQCPSRRVPSTALQALRTGFGCAQPLLRTNDSIQSARTLPLLEQRLGDRLVAGRGAAVRLDALDLAFEYFDTLAQFIDRQRIERLFDQGREYIVAAAGKVVIVNGQSFLAPSLSLVPDLKARDC